MPTYEYECLHCGHRFEASQKITAPALDNCPKCNRKVKRLISGGAGIIFKGPGFYATDYRKKPKSKESEAKTNICPQAQKRCNGCPQSE